MVFSATRLIIVTFGVLLFLGGVALTLAGDPESAAAGIALLLMGGGLIVVVVLERTRYRSEAADDAAEPVGPGGGELGNALEPRFQRTGELFVDPTTKRRMRVYVDPQTGERRYRAEG